MTQRGHHASPNAFGLPLAYHFTWGAYGIRLHGDNRPTVDRQHNQFGMPFVQSDPIREAENRGRMKTSPLYISMIQRLHVEDIMPELCDRGGWDYHVSACAADHVHVLLSTHQDAYKVRQWLKTWLTQSLASRWPSPGEPRWWAKAGSIRMVWDDAYFHDVLGYIERQRAQCVS